MKTSNEKQALSEYPLFSGSISFQTLDELRVLVELLCHTKGNPGFDARIKRLREEALCKWEETKSNDQDETRGTET